MVNIDDEGVLLIGRKHGSLPIDDSFALQVLLPQLFHNVLDSPVGDELAALKTPPAHRAPAFTRIMNLCHAFPARSVAAFNHYGVVHDLLTDGTLEDFVLRRAGQVIRPQIVTALASGDVNHVE